MKTNRVLGCLIVSLLLVATRIGVAQQSTTPPHSKIPAEVWQKAQKDGVVRIIVQLNVPWTPEGYLSPQTVSAQRQAIAAAQGKLLASLAGRQYKVTGRLWLVPGIGLEIVGWDTLAVLDFSPLVVGVELDRVARLALPQSVPSVEGDQAWTAGFDGIGWVVAILDTGVDKNHPFLTRMSIDAPTVPPAVAAGTVGTPNGTYNVIYTYVTPTNESDGSPASASITVTNQQINVSGITVGPAGTTARKIYAFKNNMSAVYQLVGTIADNTTTTFTITTDQQSWTTALQMKLVAEACFSTGGNCPDGTTWMIGSGAGVPCTYAVDGCKHGTHVAGIAAGRAASGITFNGVAKGAQLISIQVSSSSNVCGGSPPPCPTVNEIDLITGLQHVNSLRQFFSIASSNMSWGSDETYTANCDALSPMLKGTIDTLNAAGIATVIASGNNRLGLGSADAISWPGCISSAIAVGSTTKTNPFPVSSFANLAYLVSLVAPGSDICSSVPVRTPPDSNCPLPVDNFQVKDGTSMAAPHVAGAWAILKQRSPAANVSQVLAALQMTSLPIWDMRYTDPSPQKHTFQCRIRIFTALDYLSQILGPTPFVALDVLGASKTEAGGLNNCGQIVGNFADASGFRHGFQRESDGTFTTFDVPVPGIRHTRAEAINTAGQIVGSFEATPGTLHGFLRTPNPDGTFTYTTFDAAPGAQTTQAFGINSAGQIVGEFFDPAAFRIHGFLREPNGTIITVDVPGAQNTRAYGINEAGQIAGTWESPTLISHGFLRTRNPDGTFTYTTFDPPGSTWTFATGINNTGITLAQIVGAFQDASGVLHGFLRNSDGTIIAFDAPGAGRTTFATGINNAGQIVGYIQDASLAPHGFLFRR